MQLSSRITWVIYEKKTKTEDSCRKWYKVNFFFFLSQLISFFFISYSIKPNRQSNFQRSYLDSDCFYLYVTKSRKINWASIKSFYFWRTMLLWSSFSLLRATTLKLCHPSTSGHATSIVRLSSLLATNSVWLIIELKLKSFLASSESYFSNCIFSSSPFNFPRGYSIPSY